MSETSEQKTLWVGDLEHWVDELFLTQMFSMCTNQIVNIKLIRDKVTNKPTGYGFIEFSSHMAAKNVLETLNGQTVAALPRKKYRLNWAQFGINDKRSDGTGPQHSIFVGDLAAEVNDQILEAFFRERYSSVLGARIVYGPDGRSKGYGFVRFRDELECLKSITELNGCELKGKPIRISTATNKKTSAFAPDWMADRYGGDDAEKNTVLVGNIGTEMTCDELAGHFEKYGEIISVKIPVSRGHGYIEFATRGAAEKAIQGMHNQMIGTHRVRMSWGRHTPFNESEPFSERTYKTKENVSFVKPGSFESFLTAQQVVAAAYTQQQQATMMLQMQQMQMQMIANMNMVAHMNMQTYMKSRVAYQNSYADEEGEEQGMTPAEHLEMDIRMIQESLSPADSHRVDVENRNTEYSKQHAAQFRTSTTGSRWDWLIT